MLRFSANLSLLFTEYPLSERFALAKQHGFTGVEIQFPYTLPAEQIQRLLQETGLKLVLFNVAADDLLQGGEGLASVPEKQADFIVAVAQAIEYAKLLQPEYINILPGCCFNPSRLDDYLACFKNNLRYACTTFAKLGITTVFEAINTYDMPGFIVNSSQQMLAIAQELALANLGLQYDIYHLSRMGEDCALFLQQHSDKIAHIQFADVPGRGQPGSGQLNFKQLFAIINHSDYSGWLGAEYRPSQKTSESFTWMKNLP